MRTPRLAAVLGIVMLLAAPAFAPRGPLSSMPVVTLVPGAALGPVGALGPTAAVAQGPTPQAEPTPKPEPAPTGRPPLNRESVPVRIQIPSLGIDLPVMSSRATLPGNPPGYPLCDVAQYWTIYDLPGAPGTTWIYAHAQLGMFLPLLEEARATDGRGLRGREVEVQLRDGRLLHYRINEVRQHSTDRTIARRDRRGEHKLVLQTSEGPAGTIPKLMLAARLTGAEWTSAPAPRPRPRVCSDAPRPTPKPTRRPRPTATPAGDPTAGGPADLAGILVGVGAALAGGALLLTAWLRRRPV